MDEDIRQALRDIQDTLAVTAGIQQRQAELIREHGNWLAAHDRAMNEIREAGRRTDERIEALVTAIGKLIAGRQ